jgi:hypothetical protein
MKAMNETPKQRKQIQGMQKFGSVNLSALHLLRSRYTPISRTGQSTMGRIKAHGRHHKHI